MHYLYLDVHHDVQLKMTTLSFSGHLANHLSRDTNDTYAR